MDNFITVKTFSYQHELAIIRGRLESEGIECFVKDELTSQITSLYSNAIGGAKLQVRESDLEKTIVILKEAGYLNDKDFNSLAHPDKDNTDNGGDLPQKHWMVEYKGLLIGAIIVALVLIIYFMFSGSLMDIGAIN